MDDLLLSEMYLSITSITVTIMVENIIGMSIILYVPCMPLRGRSFDFDLSKLEGVIIFWRISEGGRYLCRYYCRTIYIMSLGIGHSLLKGILVGGLFIFRIFPCGAQCASKF